MKENTNFSNATKNISLVNSGKEYFSRLEQLILESKSEIHIQTYLFEYDSIGQKIIKALKNAASRNVKIYILIDGIGSFYFPSKIMAQLNQIGINIRFFSPLFSMNSLYLGRRLHHKIVVIDSKIVLIGGINIADKYHGTTTNTPWLDYAVQLNNEVIAIAASKICLNIYLRKRQIHRNKIASFLNTNEIEIVSLLQNDWLKRKTEISDGYVNSIRNAKKEIIIVGSYFLPGRRLIRALKKASKNGVKIKLILSGISDLPMARLASCHFYSKLLNNNIELYEWEKSILHGKAAVIDGNWTTIGSFNLNNLSSYGSLEMNLGINSSTFSNEFLLNLNQIMSKCKKITPESLRLIDSLPTKFINWVSYLITRAIEIIITYFPYKRFRKFY